LSAFLSPRRKKPLFFGGGAAAAAASAAAAAARCDASNASQAASSLCFASATGSTLDLSTSLMAGRAELRLAGAAASELR